MTVEVWKHRQPIHAWFLSRTDGTLRYGDDRTTVAGRTNHLYGRLNVGWSGLHASRHILHCLVPGGGSRIWRVRLHGEVQEVGTELAATNRTALWSINGADILQSFARRCALEAKCSWPFPAPAVDSFLNGDLQALPDALREWPEPSMMKGKLAVEESGVERPFIHDFDDVLDWTSWMQITIHSALRAADVAAVDDRAALKWIALTVEGRLNLASFHSTNTTAPWAEKFFELNQHLESEVWQRAYDLGLTTPDAERDWQLAQLK